MPEVSQLEGSSCRWSTEAQEAQAQETSLGSFPLLKLYCSPGTRTPSRA